MSNSLHLVGLPWDAMPPEECEAVIRDVQMATDRRLTTLLIEIGGQLAKAEQKHAPMHGPHEGYAVILEELDELWDEIKRQQIDQAAMRKEALHVAAMALRFVKDLCDREIRR